MWKRIAALWSVVRGDARHLWIALRHPMAPGWLKAGTALIVLYLVSPIDLIPDFIPVLGLLDDLLLLDLGPRRGLGPWLCRSPSPGTSTSASARVKWSSPALTAQYGACAAIA